MPASDKYKVIFVHIPKTGGSSIEQMIAPYYLYSGTVPILQHLTPKKLKKYIDDNKWNNYYKFTVVRNPFDKLVSDYKWMIKCGIIKNKSFKEFVELAKDIVTNNKYSDNKYYDHFIPQHMYFEDIEYDYVCRFETLAKDIEIVKKAINCQTKLPHVNKTKKTNYKTYYDDDTRKIVSQLYQKDLEQFNYVY